MRQIEEDHMRNRQMVAQWAYEMGMEDSVIVRKERFGKTYFVIQDYQKLREIFGMQLRELQRIKSEGGLQCWTRTCRDLRSKGRFQITLRSSRSLRQS